MTASPNLEEFLTAPVQQIVDVTPETLIFAAGGTRRSAALAGVAPHTEEYASWSRQAMLSFTNLVFTHGVRHIIAPIIISPNMIEFASYLDRFLGWIAQGLIGAETLAGYAQRGWRVRMVGAEGIPALEAAAVELARATPPRWSHTLWWTVTPTAEAPWEVILETIIRTGARTRAEAIRALYGEDIPLATIFISSGKPMVMYDLIPPLLAGDLQCYWVQRPGYGMDERLLRSILYDNAYTRRNRVGTEQEQRYVDLETQRSDWESGAVLGVGQRLGPFWYPAPFPATGGV